ncbi:protein FAR1-RELATED SEQUENCE 6-like [Silene latifolia]|uniref:protein FAR1-RELATED SEQUENCE 6-like n=1 Tax=Silene latifolia TaxID=37657 RepID=UPI003D76F8E3
MDGNNELFPIAVGVVESENKNSWSKFFWHLKQCLRESERTNWTIICDRQKGVEPALESVWPEAYRRFCVKHLCKNFKKDYPVIVMHKLFWKVVNATSEFSFKKAMESIVHHGGLGCGRWFLDLGDKEQWEKHKFDPSISSDENTSNFVESFNATLGAQRLLPVLTLLEGVRRVSMVRHVTRQHVADTWPDDGIFPNIRSILRKMKKDSRTCTTFESGRGDFEIRDGRSFLLVSLTKRECACGLWDISGILCKHAMRAIISAKKDPVDYVSEWYSVRVYKEAYGLPINPIPDMEQWHVFDLPTLEPPILRRAIGRPSRNRRRGANEGKENHCNKLEALVLGSQRPETSAAGEARKGKKQKTT